MPAFHRITAARGRTFLSLLTVALALVWCSPTAAQLNADQQADMLLHSARRAYNEKNHPFAVMKFQEFLAKYGNHKDAPSARYGLALALLDGPDKDYQKSWENLQPLLGNKESADFPFVLYYAGLSQRGLGMRNLALAATKPPPEAGPLRNTANQQFEEAAKQFGAAAAAFGTRVKELPTPDVKELPVDLEWSIRSRCDQAEMLLRLLKPKEALAAVVPLVQENVLGKSRYFKVGIYYHGFANFLLKDYLAAGRSLNQVAPFDDPVFGTHARYLMARIHQAGGERAEAAEDYEGVLAEYAKQKQAATQALTQPDKFKNDPEEKARLEALAKGPMPDHVSRCSFYVGALHAENGRFNDARDRFTAFVQQNPQSPLVAEAQLRIGFCLVQLKQGAEALKVLQPLADKEPRLADQALLWMGKAQVSNADPGNPQAYQQAMTAALDVFRRAAEKAQQNQDPDAKPRRADILLEMAETQQALKQFKEAANTYKTVLDEKAVPAREEEVLQRQIAALHLAGDHGESDKAVARFIQTFPKSTLLPFVLFRNGENAYFTLQAVEKNANLNPQDRAKELTHWQEETIKRYQALVERYPEFKHVNAARYGLGMTYYGKGELEKAKETLGNIPASERNGDLALVPYVIADCAMRLAPAKADDALTIGQTEEALKEASEALVAFLASQPTSPQAPDAMLKLGMCQQRQAMLIAQPAERNKALQTARETYEKQLAQFGKHESMPQAVIERARCIALMGDGNGAVNELRKFTQDPLKNVSVAPMGVLQLATLLRSQNKAQEAADTLNQCRQQHEQNLLKDPLHSGWAALLQYHQGVATREAGKLPEARHLFENVIKQFPNQPEAAEAALRNGQCLRDEALLKLDAANKKLATPNLKPEELATFQREHEEAVKAMRETVSYLEGQAEQLKPKPAAVEARARILYEAAWASRSVADIEIAAARSKMQHEQWQKQHDEAVKKTPPGRNLPLLPLPEVPLSVIPQQPAEQKTRALYQAVVSGFPDLPLALEARFELSELLAERAEHDNAVKLLKEALDKEPTAELGDKIRLRYGASLAVKGDTKSALAQFQAVLANPNSQWLAQANYRAGECYLQMNDANSAVKHLVVFRDQQPFQNLPGLTDRALYRLGYAFELLQKWEESRAAYEQVVNRFQNSPWIHESRYGMGWALQNLKRYDEAVNAYSQVTAQTATETAARAQFQTGLCRLEQKRYPEAATALLVVPFTFDYPELSAGALCEAARTFVELKQNEQAIKLLERVMRDHPQSKWAAVAKERLQTLKGG
jgi:TolA-binding protein